MFVDSTDGSNGILTLLSKNNVLYKKAIKKDESDYSSDEDEDKDPEPKRPRGRTTSGKSLSLKDDKKKKKDTSAATISSKVKRVDNKIEC